jgi:3-phenylpropionate/cinnamic acid dioxygenase small subunit
LRDEELIQAKANFLDLERKVQENESVYIKAVVERDDVITSLKKMLGIKQNEIEQMENASHK